MYRMVIPALHRENGQPGCSCRLIITWRATEHNTYLVLQSWDSVIHVVWPWQCELGHCGLCIVASAAGCARPWASKSDAWTGTGDRGQQLIYTSILTDMSRLWVINTAPPNINFSSGKMLISPELPLACNVSFVINHIFFQIKQHVYVKKTRMRR